MGATPNYSLDAMSCETNQHVTDMISSFLTGGQEGTNYHAEFTYHDYVEKYGENYDPSLLPELVQHREHDKTALMEFNFLQGLQTYIINTKDGNGERKYKAADEPAPFAKVMCLLMGDDMANRASLGDERTINCPNGICQVTWFLTPIWGFGCWCNFGFSLMAGSGQPVHRADEICRDLQLCLRCAKMDAKDASPPYTCDPVTQGYTYQQSAGGFVTECTLANNAGSQCAVDVCCCEQQFIADLLVEVFNPSWSYDASYKHDNGFDPNAECAMGHSTQETECCGEKPKRFPFGKDTKSCCENITVYNPVTQHCCGFTDGTVQVVGQSC